MDTDGWMILPSQGPSPWFCSAHLLKFGILCFKDPRRERKVRTAWYFHMLSHTFTYFHILSHTSSTGYIYFGSTQEHASTLQLRTSALANFSQWNSNLAQIIFSVPLWIFQQYPTMSTLVEDIRSAFFCGRLDFIHPHPVQRQVKLFISGDRLRSQAKTNWLHERKKSLSKWSMTRIHCCGNRTSSPWKRLDFYGAPATRWDICKLSVPFITVSLPNFHHGTQGTTIDPSNLGAWGAWGAWGACDTDPFCTLKAAWKGRSRFTVVLPLKFRIPFLVLNMCWHLE